MDAIALVSGDAKEAPYHKEKGQYAKLRECDLEEGVRVATGEADDADVTAAHLLHTLYRLRLVFLLFA